MLPDLPAALYDPRLRRYIAARVAPDDVDDVLHDVAVSALRGIERYEDRGYGLLAWLYRVAHSRCVDYARYHQRHPAQALHDAPYGDHAPAVEARADAAWLWPAVDALPGRQAAVLRARYADGLGLAETAAALGLTPGAVKSAQWRGLARLREGAR